MDRYLPTLLRSQDDRDYIAALALLAAAHADTVGAFGNFAAEATHSPDLWASDLRRSASAARGLFEATARIAARPKLTLQPEPTDVRRSADEVLYAVAAGYAGHLELPVIHITPEVPRTINLDPLRWSDLLLHLLNAGADTSRTVVLDISWLTASGGGVLNIALRERTGRGTPCAAASAAGQAALDLGAEPTGGSFQLSGNGASGTRASGTRASGTRVSATQGTRAETPGPIQPEAVGGNRTTHTESALPAYGVQGETPVLQALAARLEFLGLPRSDSSPTTWIADANPNGAQNVLVPGALTPNTANLDLPIQQDDIEQVVRSWTRQGAATCQLITLDANSDRSPLYERCADAAGWHFVHVASGTEHLRAEGPGLLVVDAEDPAALATLANWRTAGCELAAVAIVANETPESLRAVYALGANAHVPAPPDALVLTAALQQTRQAAEAGVYDGPRSLEIANHRQELADEMLEMLLDGLATDIGTIEDGLATRDPESLRASIHRLFGALQYCVVPRLNNALQTLRVSAHALDWDVAAQQLLALQGEAAILQYWFEAGAKPARDDDAISRTPVAGQPDAPG